MRQPAIILPIRSAPGYFAGNDGVIYSVRGRWRDVDDPPSPLAAGKQSNGYLTVCLVDDDGGRRMARVHRLVCEAFHGPCPPGMECSHLDDDKTNNRPENLRWETSKQNQRRRRPNGVDDRGVLNSRAALTVDDVRQVREWLADGRTTVEIAQELDVSRPVISRIKNGRRYQHDG